MEMGMNIDMDIDMGMDWDIDMGINCKEENYQKNPR